MSPKAHQGSNREPSPWYGALQDMVESLYHDLEQEAYAPYGGVHVPLDPDEAPTVRRLDVVIAAEAADLPEDLLEIVNLLPPGDYDRERLCNQLNSALAGRALGQVYGTVA